MNTIAAQQVADTANPGREKGLTLDQIIVRVKQISAEEVRVIIAAAAAKLPDAVLEEIRQNALDYAHDRGMCGLLGVSYDVVVVDPTAWGRLVVFAMFTKGQDPMELLERKR